MIKDDNICLANPIPPKGMPILCKAFCFYFNLASKFAIHTAI